MSKVTDFVNSLPDKRNAQALVAAFEQTNGSATVAAAGTNQATAAALTGAVNAVTGADGTKAVRLPIPQPGDPGVWVINTAASVLNVYPAVGGQINALGTDAVYALAASQAGYFIPASAILWYTGIVGATSAQIAYLTGAVAGTGAASKVAVLDAGEDFVWPATGILTYGVLKDPAGTTLGATVAELNMAADNSANCELVTTTNVITAAESGKTFFLDSATDFLSTLPAPALGLRYTFIVKTCATTTAHTIGTNAGANIIQGAVATTDGNASVLASNEDLISLTKTATGGIVGDQIEVISDGTNWFVSGLVSVAAGITFTVT